MTLYLGQFLRLLSRPFGGQIVCRKGTLWITQEGDSRDYVLNAGDCFFVTRPGLVLIESLSARARVGVLKGKRDPARLWPDARGGRDVLLERLEHVEQSQERVRGCNG